MSTLGFDNYVEPLKLYLQKYREANKGDKSIMGAASEGGESSSGASASTSFTADPLGEGAQGSTVVFTYDVGQSSTT